VVTVAKARLEAVQVLLEVLQQGRSLTQALERALPQAGTEAALVQAMCYGVCRWYYRLQAIAEAMLDKPLKQRDSDIHCLILLGLFQLIYMRVPAHAAVQETVAVTRLLKKHWASGLVNALLRRFQREADAILTSVDQDEIAATAHPRWLLQQLQQSWPADWTDITTANNTQAPMSLRVNLARQDRGSYLRQLQGAGIPAELAPVGEAAVVLQQAVDVERLPGFQEGLVSVQDCAAQLAAELLSPRAGEQVLDACAAPGGKTAHIIERMQVDGDDQPAVTAVDIDEQRCARIQQNLQRLGQSARLVTADVAATADWCLQPFDRVLLDAPCSATGVIRRHPDIKLLRRPGDISTLMQTQARLLRAVWPLLKPGGTLLYATCSILPMENVQVVSDFLAEAADAREQPIQADWGRPQAAGRQILPGENGMDGFYYARLVKQE
jgi:16S rRNA (cytosine967-C5)-methyltransferase